jgi:hypothetical protein
MQLNLDCPRGHTVDVRSKEQQQVCGCSPVEIVCSNPTSGIDNAGGNFSLAGEVSSRIFLLLSSS